MGCQECDFAARGVSSESCRASFARSMDQDAPVLPGTYQSAPLLRAKGEKVGGTGVTLPNIPITAPPDAVALSPCRRPDVSSRNSMVIVDRIAEVP